MKSSLEELFYGKIAPANHQPYPGKSKPHKNLDDELLKVLNGNVDLFDELIRAEQESKEDVPYYNFKQGFILGSKLMIEIMRDEKQPT